MTMLTFAILFNAGFALADTCIEVAAIIKGKSGIEIKGFSSRNEAYVYACTGHVEREFKKNPYAQTTIPRLEAMDISPVFHSAGFIPQGVSQRVFAAVSSDYAGILTTLEAVAEFLEFKPLHSEVREVGSIIGAQHFINYYYLKYILPMSAYISEAIPYCNNIPVNVMVQMPYIEWVKKHCMVPRQIPFARYPSTEQLTEVVTRVPVNSNMLTYNVSV